MIIATGSTLGRARMDISLAAEPGPPKYEAAFRESEIDAFRVGDRQCLVNYPRNQIRICSGLITDAIIRNDEGRARRQ